MCGGGFLGLSPKEETAKVVKMPKPQTPAAPAPERKQDTGAIVAVGDTESQYSDERRRRAARTPQRGGSSLGSLGGTII